MIQGTMSSAGKSILAGGLCRVFKQDGYRVAPFKSQNMALNSFITEDGLEMGRAQVMQAEAAGIKPCVSMNPILLKPTSDCGSQVIVNGEVTEVLKASEYYQKKKEYIPVILNAYRKLEAEYDVIVIEGAGSPAEINLKADDIVNMGLAKMVDAPVLLVGDIDRGGVFAQIVGTIELLEAKERERIKGIVINKFRGDKEILKPGLAMLEERIHIPVHGVIPYFHLDIDDEDSLSERFYKNDTVGLLDIAVIKLPRISNFTDFAPFEYVKEVSVRYVDSVHRFGNPNLVILPGSKNTIEDLLWMRQNGLEAKVIRHAEQEKPVIGICGGYQMLGEQIMDPEGMEHKGEVQGMGLLPILTTFASTKVRTRVSGRICNAKGLFQGLNGVELEGYEIHMGSSVSLDGSAPFAILSDQTKLGQEKPDGRSCGNVWGTYVHGIFDQPGVVTAIVTALLNAKGYAKDTVQVFDIDTYKEKQYDLLADMIREHLDMEQIYRIVAEGNAYRNR